MLTLPVLIQYYSSFLPPSYSTWNLNASLPAQCPCVGEAGYLVTIWKFNREKWPKDSFGLISSVTDTTISTFFSFGMDNCKKVHKHMRLHF